jgi:hypothetical protein
MTRQRDRGNAPVIAGCRKLRVRYASFAITTHLYHHIKKYRTFNFLGNFQQDVPIHFSICRRDSAFESALANVHNNSFIFYQYVQHACELDRRSSRG